MSRPSRTCNDSVRVLKNHFQGGKRLVSPVGSVIVKTVADPPLLDRGQLAFGPFTPVETFLIEVFNVVLEASSFFGLKLTRYESQRLRLQTLRLWMDYLPHKTEKEAIKLSKYKMAAFFSAHKGLELPPWPFPGHNKSDKPIYLLGGKYRAWQRLLAISSQTKWDSYLATISIGVKKGCPRPSPTVVKEGVLSTFKELTTMPSLPTSVSWADDDMKFSSEDMIAEIKRTVHELFDEVPAPRLGQGVEPFLPSTSANYIKSRSELGAVGYFLSENKSLTPNLVMSDLSLAQEVRSDVDEKIESFILDDRPGKTVFSRFIANVDKAARSELPDVQLVGLSEAFKVRVISKGPPVLSTRLKIIQKWLWSTLSKHQTFQLIGRPVEEVVIQNVIGQLFPNESFASLDYSAATDLLYSKYSEIVVEEIAECTDMEPATKVFFKMLLTKHRIEDPVTGQLVQQRRGQLMGSIVSFPILCILNAAVCRICCEFSRNGGYHTPLKKQISLRLDQCPLLINGDDALMRLTPEAYAFWKEVSKIVGFSPSIGKTFYTREFCQINSVNFNYVEPYLSFVGEPSKLRTLRYRRVSYINMGLLFGKTRSSAQNSKAAVADATGTLGMRMRSLLRDAPSTCSQRLAAAFVARAKPQLLRCRLPWFLPEKVGGLGLVGLPSLEDWLYFGWVLGRLESLPPNHRPVSLAEPAAWQFRPLAQKFIESKGVVARRLTIAEKRLAEEAQTWLGTMMIFDPAIKNDWRQLNRVVNAQVSVAAAIRRNEEFTGRGRRVAAALHSEFSSSVPMERYLDSETMRYKHRIIEREECSQYNVPEPMLDYPVFLRKSTHLFEPSFGLTTRTSRVRRVPWEGKA